MTTVVPAYGRDYTSANAVKKALQKQLDFQICDISSKWDGKYACLYDLKHSKENQVTVRYSKLRKVAIFDMEDL